MSGLPVAEVTRSHWFYPVKSVGDLTTNQRFNEVKRIKKYGCCIKNQMFHA